MHDSWLRLRDLLVRNKVRRKACIVIWEHRTRVNLVGDQELSVWVPLQLSEGCDFLIIDQGDETELISLNQSQNEVVGRDASLVEFARLDGHPQLDIHQGFICL